MSELPDEVILAVVALEKQYGDGHHSFELREGIYDLLSSSQARLSETVKVLEDVTKALGEFTSQAPTMLSCGRHCTAEVEHMEEEAYASAHNHASFQLRQAKAFLATIGEET